MVTAYKTDARAETNRAGKTKTSPRPPASGAGGRRRKDAKGLRLGMFGKMCGEERLWTLLGLIASRRPRRRGQRDGLFNIKGVAVRTHGGEGSGAQFGIQFCQCS